jgi:hypothetical protein
MTPVGNGWYRCSVVRSATSSAASQYLGIYASNANGTLGYQGVVGSGIYIWGADLRVTNDGVGLPAYQRVGDVTVTPADYDSTDFPLYLRFDGVDDGLYTGANVDFSATDKVTVCAGLRKLSDAGVVAELSTNTNGINGTFYVSAPSVSPFGWESQIGENSNSRGRRATGIPAPNTSVVTASLDRAGATAADEVKLRVNSATPAETTVGIGGDMTGNFGSFPFFLGGRGDTTFRFNGRIYSLVIVGRTLQDAELLALEQWTNGKARAY